MVDTGEVFIRSSSDKASARSRRSTIVKAIDASCCISTDFLLLLMLISSLVLPRGAFGGNLSEDLESDRTREPDARLSRL